VTLSAQAGWAESRFFGQEASQRPGGAPLPAPASGHQPAGPQCGPSASRSTTPLYGLCGFKGFSQSLDELERLERERRAALEIARRLKLAGRLRLLKLSNSRPDGLSWGEVQDGELFIVFWRGLPVFRVLKGRVITFRMGPWLAVALDLVERTARRALEDLRANWKPLPDSPRLQEGEVGCAGGSGQTRGGAKNPAIEHSPLGVVSPTGALVALRRVTLAVQGDPVRLKRFKNARDVHVEVIAVKDGLVEARANNRYTTIVAVDLSVASCECRDWLFNLTGTSTPCKHVYAVAIAENLPR